MIQAAHTVRRVPAHRLTRFVFAALLAAASLAAGAVEAVDAAGARLVLAQAARRIVSLAPNVTELLFAAGAGERVVGAVRYSDYPEAARRIPRIGDANALDLERIVALKPDLIVLWRSGDAQRQLDALLRVGIPVYASDAHRIADIARDIEHLSVLAGTTAQAERAAQSFRARAAALRERYAGRSHVRVFFQVWDEPLMTVNDEHLISDVIRLCGGENVFAGVKSLASVISTEAVLAADPEAIVGMAAGAGNEAGLDAWKSWPRLAAVARGNLILLPADVISRSTPRVLDGAQMLCERLDAVRAQRR